MHVLPAENAREIADIVTRDGVMGALGYLNARTPHRFTGVFRFAGSMLENLYLFDRENSRSVPWATFAATQSFCSIMRITGEPFSAGDASSDPRVSDHPARETVLAYCGVPLFHPDGSVYGSLCHFDYRPALFSDVDLTFLAAAAPVLLPHILLEHP